MMSFLQKNHRAVFYGSWLFLSLVQAGLTELQDDEAYYWVYSRFLDWGYFDHPPMTGLLVKMGYAIFPNELGVRLLPLLLNFFSILIIESLLGKKNPLLFYIIILSIAALQLIGFAAVPDIPLIFFTALFFWCYRRFIRENSIINAVLLGIAMAALCYSKYHALLVILFTLLSNLKLLLRYQAWLAALVALLIFLPHLWWQYQHDWVSFKYHLFESNVNAYKFSFTSDYILGQLLLPGPIAGFILLPAAFLYKPQDDADRALKFTMIGIYAFFLLSSFRGRVEANWTSPVLVSLVVLSHQYFMTQQTSRSQNLQRWLIRCLPITLGLVLIARIAMIVDIFPIKEIKKRYHSWKQWPEELRDKTNGEPVVFSNSYQRASKYWFYSGQTTYSQNWYRERKNNYNFWPIEDSMLGKPAWFFDIYGMNRFTDSLKTPIGWVGYKREPVMAAFAKINIRCDKKKYEVAAGEALELTCTFDIPVQYTEFIMAQQERKDTTSIGVFKNGIWIKDLSTDLTLKQMVRERRALIRIRPALPTGKYYLRFSIAYADKPPTHNSDKIKLEID